jgi:hypothetical protein
MHDTFEAHNELEEKLMAAQEGQLPGTEFMHYLLDTQVFIPVKDSVGIEGFTASDKAVPLILRAEDGMEILIIYTSPERARIFLQDYPGFEGGLLVEFKWVLERTGTSIGISINPDWPVGMDLGPEMVQQLRVN